MNEMSIHSAHKAKKAHVNTSINLIRQHMLLNASTNQQQALKRPILSWEQGKKKTLKFDFLRQSNVISPPFCRYVQLCRGDVQGNCAALKEKKLLKRQ